MIYCSIDIETSGLDPTVNSILSIGAIIEDTDKKLPYDECPKFNVIIVQKQFVGSPTALKINKDIISLMSNYLNSDDETKHNYDTHSDYVFLDKEDVVKKFYQWLHGNGYHQGTMNSGGHVEVVNGITHPVINNKTIPITINVAGKNFATFDKLFLEQLPMWQKLIKIRQRVLDPAILMVDWKNDTSLPNLTTCKERANVDGVVTHNALEDAWDVIQILRKFY